jgi:internalin A
MAKKIYILFLLLTLKLQLGFAANTVTISDANFLSFLTTTYGSPTIVGNQLDTLQAAVKTGVLNCRARGISDINGIQYFKSISLLNLNRNNLTSIPSLKNFTSLMMLYCDSNLLTSLPDLNQITTLSSISCRVNYLSTLPSLTGLSNLTSLNCSNNKITVLPSLAGLNSLTFLSCAENELISLPASLSTLINLENIYCGMNHLTSIPSLTNVTKLQYLFCSENELTSLPVLNSCTLLKYIRISNNKITQLPDLSFMNAPVIVYLDRNNLSFEDLLPVVNSSNYASYSSAFLLFPQNKFGNYADTLVKKNGSFNFNLNIDPAVSLAGTTNTYTWYRNGSVVNIGNVNIFTKTGIMSSDSGTYRVVIRNNHPAFVNDSLVSNTKKLKIGECFLGSSLNYTATTISCNEGFKVTFDLTASSNAVLPYTYIISDLSNGKKTSSSSPVLSGVKEGEYFLIVKDKVGCRTITVFCQLVASENCDPVFSPNGDGVADTYYIDTPGKARIYNKSGQLVHELITPAYWDGLDKTGNEVAAGYYVIIINEKTSTNVSLMR